MNLILAFVFSAKKKTKLIFLEIAFAKKDIMIARDIVVINHDIFIMKKYKKNKPKFNYF
jgi:hypothetical protein